MADTTVRLAASSAARCLFPNYPRGYSATAAPASSIRHPTSRNARLLRRRRPSRSAGAGNCNQPGAIAYAGKSRSCRVRHGAAIARPSARNLHNAPASGTLSDISWAACSLDELDLPGSQAWNRQPNVIVPHSPEIQPFQWQRSKGPMDDDHSGGYAFFETAVTESIALNQLALN
jgi:hypothetical protein